MAAFGHSILPNPIGSPAKFGEFGDRRILAPKKPRVNAGPAENPCASASVEAIMAQRRKRVTVGKRKSTGRGRTRKSSGFVRGKATKPATTKLRPKKGVAKAKHPRAKKLGRKKARPAKPPIAPVVETTTVDVVEQPAPAVTEFEETDIREPGPGE